MAHFKLHGLRPGFCNVGVYCAVNLPYTDVLAYSVREPTFYGDTFSSFLQSASNLLAGGNDE